MQESVICTKIFIAKGKNGRKIGLVRLGINNSVMDRNTKTGQRKLGQGKWFKNY